MAKRFEMREVGTGRLLGTMATVDDHAPGAVVGMFRDDLVQVDVLPAGPVSDSPALAATVADPAAEEARRPKGRRAR